MKARTGAAALPLFIALGACAPRADLACRPTAVRAAGPHKLTNPLLDLEGGVEFHELSSFRHKLDGLVDAALASREASHVSIYFRDLNNGPWFGVRQEDYFSPASLFKVPFMMGILKQAEGDPGLLARRLKVDLPADKTPLLVPPTVHVEPGRVYTVEELLELVIAHSDNVALDALYALQLRDVYAQVYADLGMAVPAPDAKDAPMRVKDYAAFFRILYNASYLSRGMSEKALAMLTRSSFTQGIPAGLPPGTVVAHKFGERAIEGNPELQLHDCGIVYHARTPYVLCVMTRGPKLEGLLKTIRSASALVYAEVDKR